MRSTFIETKSTKLPSNLDNLISSHPFYGSTPRVGASADCLRACPGCRYEPRGNRRNPAAAESGRCDLSEGMGYFGPANTQRIFGQILKRTSATKTVDLRRIDGSCNRYHCYCCDKLPIWKDTTSFAALGAANVIFLLGVNCKPIVGGQFGVAVLDIYNYI